MSYKTNREAERERLLPLPPPPFVTAQAAEVVAELINTWIKNKPGKPLNRNPQNKRQQ